jgi:prefoldin subunit 5
MNTKEIEDKLNLLMKIIEELKQRMQEITNQIKEVERKIGF